VAGRRAARRVGRPGTDGERPGRQTETRVGTASLTWLRRSRPGRRPVTCRFTETGKQHDVDSPFPFGVDRNSDGVLHACMPASTSWTVDHWASGLILGRAIDRYSCRALRRHVTSQVSEIFQSSPVQEKSDQQTRVFTPNCQLVSYVYAMQLQPNTLFA